MKFLRFYLFFCLIIFSTYPSILYSKRILNIQINNININNSCETNDEVKIIWQASGVSGNSYKDSYGFIIFSLPNSIRLDGKGFMMIPPAEKLPLNIKIDEEKFRIVFPLKNISKKNSGIFTFNPLLTDKYEIACYYVIANRLNRFEILQKDIFEIIVQNTHPELIIQQFDYLNNLSKKPKKIISSFDNEYEILVFKEQFRVFNKEKDLLFEKYGINPNFSPNSRFLCFRNLPKIKQHVLFKSLQPQLFEFTVIDLFNFDEIYKAEGTHLMWSKNETIFFVCHAKWGYISVVFPFLKSSNNINIDDDHKLLPSNYCHACDGWGRIAEILDQQLINKLFFSAIDKNDYYYKSWGFFLSDNLCFTDELNNKSKYFVKTYRDNKNPLKFNNSQKFYPSNLINAVPTRAINIVPISESLSHEDDKILSQIQLVEGTEFSTNYKINNKMETVCTPFDQENDCSTNQIKKSLKYISRISYETTKYLFPKQTNAPDTNDGCYSYSIPSNINYWYWNASKNEILMVRSECQSRSSGTSGIWNEGIINLYIKNKSSRRYSHYTLNDHYFRYAHDRNNVRTFLSKRNKVIILNSTTNGVIDIFNIGEQKHIHIKEIPDSFTVKSLYLSLDEQKLLQINRSNKLFVYNLKNCEIAFTGKYIENELILYADNGNYFSTDDGYKYIKWFFKGLRKFFDNTKHFQEHFESSNNDRFSLTSNKKNKQFIPPPVLDMNFQYINTSKGLMEITAKSLIGLSSLSIFNDGIEMYNFDIRDKKMRESYFVDIPQGIHWLSAAAFDIENKMSTPKTIMTKSTTSKNHLSGNYYFIGIGIDHYNKIKNGNLKYAKRDIISFMDIISSFEGQQFKKLYIKTIFDEDVKNQKVLTSISQFIQKSQKFDTVIFYFAGHSKITNNEMYLLTSHSSLINIEKNSLNWTKIAQTFAKCKSKVIIFLDSCHSGFASVRNKTANVLNKTKIPGMVILASSKKNQYSIESDQFDKQSVFNYALSQVLVKERFRFDYNKNGIIELSELYYGAKTVVNSLSNGSQIPWMSSKTIIGEIPFL